MTKELEPSYLHCLNAVEGWLGLGNLREAELEFANLPSSLMSHPEVLRVRYHLEEKRREWDKAAETAKQLCQIVPESPFGWIHQAYALHELGRTQEAYSVLKPVRERFPEEYVILYNLACYSCRLGNLDEAILWLKQAIVLARSETIKKMALADPDLESLRGWIEKI